MRNWGHDNEAEHPDSETLGPALEAQILDAALDLFTSLGYLNVTLVDVAVRASVPESVVAAKFATPFDLFEALYEQVAGDCLRRVLDGVDLAPNNFLEQLHAGVSEYVHALLDDPRRARLIGVEANGISRAFDAKRRQERRTFAGLIAQLAVTYEDHHIIHVRLPNLTYAGLVSALFEMVSEYASLPAADRPPLDILIDEVARFTKGVVVTPPL